MSNWLKLPLGGRSCPSRTNALSAVRTHTHKRATSHARDVIRRLHSGLRLHALLAPDRVRITARDTRVPSDLVQVEIARAISLAHERCVVVEDLWASTCARAHAHLSPWCHREQG
eukprot:1223215-Prymnesium_polylepis.1